MIDISIFKKVKGTKLEIPDTSYINGKYARRLRTNIFHLSQHAFAEALGVSTKTVEKWESQKQKNELYNATKKLLYLLEKHPELMRELYSFVDEKAQQSCFELKMDNKFIGPIDIYQKEWVQSTDQNRNNNNIPVLNNLPVETYPVTKKRIQYV